MCVFLFVVGDKRKYLRPLDIMQISTLGFMKCKGISTANPKSNRSDTNLLKCLRRLR